MSTNQAIGAIFKLLQRLGSQITYIQTDNQSLVTRYEILEVRNPSSATVIPSDVENTSGTSQAILPTLSNRNNGIDLYHQVP